MKTMIRRMIASSFAAILLASCATISPESRVREGLVDAGLSRPMAGCMAREMVGRLSLTQLRRVQSLASLRNSYIESLSLDRFLYKLRALEDPEIFATASKAAIRCAL